MSRLKKFISENQGRLPFGGFEARGAQRAGTTLALERRALGGVLGIVGLLIAIYVVLVMLSVAHVAAREAIVHSNQDLAERVSSLEATFLSRSAAVTEVSAASFGFVPATSRTFVERTELGFVSSNAR